MTRPKVKNVGGNSEETQSPFCNSTALTSQQCELKPPSRLQGHRKDVKWYNEEGKMYINIAQWNWKPMSVLWTPRDPAWPSSPISLNRWSLEYLGNHFLLHALVQSLIGIRKTHLTITFHGTTPWLPLSALGPICTIWVHADRHGANVRVTPQNHFNAYI